MKICSRLVGRRYLDRRRFRRHYVDGHLLKVGPVHTWLHTIRLELRGDELLGQRAAARCRCAALQEIGGEESEIGVYLADRHHGSCRLLGSRGGGNKNQRQAGDGRMTGDGHYCVSSDWWEHCILLQINYPPEGADVSASRVIPRSRRHSRSLSHWGTWFHRGEQTHQDQSDSSPWARSRPEHWLWCSRRRHSSPSSSTGSSCRRSSRFT